MLTSIRGLSAATLAGAFALSTPAFATEAEASSADVTTVLNGEVTQADYDRAMAQVDQEKASHQDGGSGLEFSANVALTTDYRFRGVSLSGGDMAIQGGFDVSHSSGFYVGTWASSISGGDAFGELELDVYAGYGGELSEGLSFDIGLLYYMYPTEDIGANVNYWEPYASIGFDLGPASATVGVAYAWEQDSLGGGDNLYLYTDLEAAIPNTPITLSAHLGYTDGVLAPRVLVGELDDTGLDWSVGASTDLGGFSLGVAFVGTQGPNFDGFTDDMVVATLSASF